MKTIFATAVQYPARLAAALRQNDLPAETQGMLRAGAVGMGGLCEPLSRPFTQEMGEHEFNKHGKSGIAVGDALGPPAAPPSYPNGGAQP